MIHLQQNEAYPSLEARSRTKTERGESFKLQPLRSAKKCMRCRRSFVSQIEKHFHQLEDHNDRNSQIKLRCDICKEIFVRSVWGTVIPRDTCSL